MRVLAIDPGNIESAFVDSSDGRTFGFGKVDNMELLRSLRVGFTPGIPGAPDHLAIEMIASYGMPVGAEVFDTCVWIGRFVEAFESPRPFEPGPVFTRVYRKDVKLHLCGQPRAKDANIRAALIDKFGGKDKAIGNKKAPGPLYGMSADVWAALGVYVTFTETMEGASVAK